MPSSEFIPYGRQAISDADVAAVVEVLRSDYLTQGPVVPRFESELVNHCGAAYAVAVNSATSALHLACLALGLGPGDELWTTPNTFVASANCGRYCGARVDFVDIDPRSYNLSAERLAEKLEQAAELGRRPKVLVAVHFAGQACDMRAIHELAKRYDFAVIEDASHALGGFYEGAPIGSGSYSDITIFSFHPVKIITTGEGGMALTQRVDLAERMASLRSHGITRDPAKLDRESEGPWYYQQVELGFNYRMTDFQAALGLSQLGRLTEFIAARERLADRYDRLLADFAVTLPWRAPSCRPAWHLYVVLLPEAKRKRVFEAMRAQGIGVNVHYIPVHLQPDYRRLGFAKGDFPESERYYDAALTLPLFPTLTDTGQDRVVEALGVALR